MELDQAAPDDANNDAKEFANRIFSETLAAGRAWAAAEARRRCEKIDQARRDSLAAAGVDPPSEPSPSPPSVSDFEEGLQKSLSLKFENRLISFLAHMGAGMVDPDFNNLRFSFRSDTIPAFERELDWHETKNTRRPAAREAVASGDDAGACANPVSIEPGRRITREQLLAQGMTGETLAAGTRVMIGGLPFWLDDDTRIIGADGNFKLAGVR
jgi:hypothetical protein